MIKIILFVLAFIVPQWGWCSDCQENEGDRATKMPVPRVDSDELDSANTNLPIPSKKYIIEKQKRLIFILNKLIEIQTIKNYDYVPPKFDHIMNTLDDQLATFTREKAVVEFCIAQAKSFQGTLEEFNAAKKKRKKRLKEIIDD
jgi:hypothetical protein